MNTEVYDTYHVGTSHIADTMPSGLTLYTEAIANAEIAYTLTLADGQGLTWTMDDDHDWTWTDTIIRNAVRNETDLHRLSQLLNMYGIESHWCNHVETPATVKEPNIIAKENGITAICNGHALVIHDAQGEPGYSVGVLFDKVAYDELRVMCRLAVHTVADMDTDRAYTVAVSMSRLFGGDVYTSFTETRR